ncbi:MAG: ribosome maturation factor RimM [Armatimonadota bacterium]
MVQKNYDILIGKITSSFGIKGEVKIQVLTDFPNRFDVGNEIIIKKPDGSFISKKILSSRETKGNIIVGLDGVEDRNAADDLRGYEIVISDEDLVELPEDRYYLFDLIGINVVTNDGREIGAVTEVIQAGANDVYVTSTDICIPAIKQVVLEVDIKNKKMVIFPMPGLLPEN